MIYIKGTLLKCPDIEGDSLVDARSLTHDHCVKNIGILAELIIKEEVQQIWLDSDQNGHFLEIKGDH